MKRFRKSLTMRQIILGVLLIVFAIASLVVPFAINELYKKGTGYVTLWNAADVLAFYGSYLSFLGTVILGIVAIYQNKKAYKLNEQLQKLQQAQYISVVSVATLEVNKQSASYPNYVNLNMRKIENIDLTGAGCESQHSYHIDVEFENSSQYPIVQLGVHVGERENDNCVLFGIEKRKESAIYIPAHGKQAVRFILPSDRLEKQGVTRLKICIDFVNIFDYVTPGAIYLEDIESKTKKEFKFRLSKFTDIKPMD